MVKRILTLVFFAISFGVQSQCAMCKAQLESGSGEVGNGINEGILFLMIIPYILLTALLFVFFNGKVKASVIKFINS